VSAGNEGACDRQARVEYDKLKKPIRDETIWAKVKNLFTVLERNSYDAVLVAEGAFLFHTTKHPSS